MLVIDRDWGNPAGWPNVGQDAQPGHGISTSLLARAGPLDWQRDLVAHTRADNDDPLASRRAGG